ncbi:MAG: Clp1/GlmU family protein, partial [Desulfonauticus sp.]|nr:Clp1/GlmU family protein [Desulfonauticus sp.]
MNRTVDAGKTLIVDGPASVMVSSGIVEVFGLLTNDKNKIVIREGKRLPFVVRQKATFEISLGENANEEEVDSDTIPNSWIMAFKKVLESKKQSTVTMVLGAIDSGKTSFCTYLVNKLLNLKKKVAVLDGDLGQSDIGPPCTIAYAFVTEPIADLFSLEAENAFFVGVTSPSKASEKVIEGLVLLEKEILENGADFIIVNTDGWIEGENAINYKVQLVKKLKPDILFAIQQGDELKQLLQTLESSKPILVRSPSAIKQRSREKRKSLRELGYIKYLKNAKVQSIPLNWLKLEGSELFSSYRTYEDIQRTREIYGLLGMKPLYFKEQKDKIFVVIGRNRWIDKNSIEKVEEYTKKKVVVIRKGEEEGLLVALFNASKNFLGIGILQEVDYRRKFIKI